MRCSTKRLYKYGCLNGRWSLKRALSHMMWLRAITFLVILGEENNYKAMSQEDKEYVCIIWETFTTTMVATSLFQSKIRYQVRLRQGVTLNKESKLKVSLPRAFFGMTSRHDIFCAVLRHTIRSP
jgi:hypothetical protein